MCACEAVHSSHIHDGVLTHVWPAVCIYMYKLQSAKLLPNVVVLCSLAENNRTCTFGLSLAASFLMHMVTMHVNPILQLLV